MPYFTSNDPSSFGWSLPPQVVPFIYRGQAFPGGVHPLVSPIFTRALDLLCAQPGFALHPGQPDVSGDWGYEARGIIGSASVPSFHAYGLAIDVNAPWNPHYADPPGPGPWRVPANADQLLRPLGILWSGSPEFAGELDWMHLEVHLSPAEIGRPPVSPGPGGRPPFPLPGGDYYGPFSGPAESISGVPSSDAPWRPGLRLAQQHLGVAADGLYGPQTAAAIRTWQLRHHLVPDALLGPVTWKSIFG
jgi:peptidoglycan hydrolase-like protein with peptidoglycan-binding domain